MKAVAQESHGSVSTVHVSQAERLEQDLDAAQRAAASGTEHLRQLAAWPSEGATGAGRCGVVARLCLFFLSVMRVGL